MIDIPQPFHHRYRYIGFAILSPSSKINITRKDMISSLRHHCESMYHQHCATYGIFLTRFQHNKGIVRCFHTEKDRTIHLLTSIKSIRNMQVEVKTLGTSGTIKALIKKHLDGETLQEKKRGK